MSVKELEEALAAYPDDMNVQILSIFAPNYREMQKDFYSIGDVELNNDYQCVTLLESDVSVKTKVVK